MFDKCILYQVHYVNGKGNPKQEIFYSQKDLFDTLVLILMWKKLHPKEFFNINLYFYQNEIFKESMMGAI